MCNIIAPLGGQKKVFAHKRGKIKSGRAQKRFATSWRHDAIASWAWASQYFSHLSLTNTLGTYLGRFSKKKRENPDFYVYMTSARHDVMTSSTFFHHLICTYTISIFSESLKAIGWKLNSPESILEVIFRTFTRKTVTFLSNNSGTAWPILDLIFALERQFVGLSVRFQPFFDPGSG